MVSAQVHSMFGHREYDQGTSVYIQGIAWLFAFRSCVQKTCLVVYTLYILYIVGVGGTMVSIAAFQTVDPGSLPVQREMAL